MHLIRALVVIVSMLVAVACGGDASSGSADPGSSREAERDVRAAFDANAEAWADGEFAQVCAGFTQRYAEEFVQETRESGLVELETEECEEAVRQVHRLARSFDVDFDRDRQRVTSVEVVPDGAQATVVATSNDVDQEYELVLEDGEWLIDSDDDLEADEVGAPGGPDEAEDK